MLKKLEVFMAEYIPWVYYDGVSSVLHALVVLAAYLVPGFVVRAVLSPLSGLVAGMAVGVLVQYLYWQKEFGPNGDKAKVEKAFADNLMSKKKYSEKKRDAFRDFAFTIISTIIGVGVLIEMVVLSGG